LQRLAALLDPSEREDFLLLWKPQLHKLSAAPTTATVSAAAAAAAAAVSAASHPAGLRYGAAKGSPAALLRCNSSVSEGIFKMGIKVGVVATSEVGSSTTSTGEDSLPASGNCSDVELACSDGEDSSSSGSSSPLLNKPKIHRGAVLAPEQAEAVARMKAVPHRWRDFHINSGAFLYCSVFRMAEPEALMPVSNGQVIKWLNIKPEDRWIRHQFKLYK
jgi:hypothetical protein